MPDADKPRVFDYAFRGESTATHPGDGYGLNLVASIMSLYNGTSEIRDNTPQGTVITIRQKSRSKSSAAERGKEKLVRIVVVCRRNLLADSVDCLQDGIACVHVNFHCQTPGQFPRFTIRMSLPGLAFGGRNGRRS